MWNVAMAIQVRARSHTVRYANAATLPIGPGSINGDLCMSDLTRRAMQATNGSHPGRSSGWRESRSHDRPGGCLVLPDRCNAAVRRSAAEPA